MFPPIVPLALALLLAGLAPSATAQPITNLQQLTQTLSLEPRISRNVDLLATVCAASRPKVGVLIVQDETGVELLELGNFEREIVPGERIRIRGWYCLLRKRDLGVEVSANPVVDNDGLHIRRTWGGEASLRQGQNPIRLEWFNSLREFHLEVYGSISNEPIQGLSPTNLWHAVVDESGRTNFLPGLRAECYEGYWEAMPEFDLLQPVKTGIATNLDLEFRTRDEMVALRYTGYLNVPRAGQYLFRTRSDDGSLLFLGKPELPVVRTGVTNVPVAARRVFGELMSNLAERGWVTVEGRVNFVSKEGEGLEFELRSDRDVVSVRVADAAGLEVSRLRNAQVRVTGVGRAVLTADQRLILGSVFVAGAREVALVDNEPGRPAPVSLNTVAQVQGMPLEDARRALPVRVRGVVTDARNSFYDHRMSLQDDTRGIFVNLNAITNVLSAVGEFVEVEGHSGAGDFAPVIVARKVTLLGEGRLPEPARPTWTELLNGSMDVQWAELKGLVTDVQSNVVTLLLPEGRLSVRMDSHHEPELKSFEKTIARIRGVLYAEWNPDTREVRVGSVLMRNATIVVETAAPADPFEVVVKTPRELLMFDAQATAFRRVKVRGQIIYADAGQMFLQEDGAGLRLLPAQKTDVQAGDLVEAVGYPDFGRTELLLREVILRKTGAAPLLAARSLAESELTSEGLDSTRVRVEGKLLGAHPEHGVPVLEMQSGAHLFLARLAPGKSPPLSLRPGSWLALEGVYVGHGRSQRLNAQAEPFELLLNSPASVAVLSQPSWWTPQRLITVVGVLLVSLSLAAVWISQLRRLVEQRTRQLQREIREREAAERQRALEAERSRIARDLHDDLGSSLTEINVLASTGLRRTDAATATQAGLRREEMASAPPAGLRPEESASAGQGVQGSEGARGLFQTIGDKARSLIAALDVIVWAVDPDDNTLQSVADYLSGFAGDYLSHTPIACRFKVPVSFPSLLLDGRVRHDLLLMVKETLNNTVRHGQASEVEFRMAVTDNALEITVADNGKGFDAAAAKAGSGLKNLSTRLTAHGGDCRIESAPGKGTTVTIRLPLLDAAKPPTAPPANENRW